MVAETLPDVRRSQSPWLHSTLLGLLSLALTLYCLELIKINGQISPLWFSTTLMTAIVFRCPLHRLPIMLGSCMMGIICANMLAVGPILATLQFPLVNLAQALAGGYLLRRLVNRQAPLNSIYSWAKIMLVAGLLTPLLSGMLAIVMLNIPAESHQPFFATWVASEVIGMLALGPVVILWHRDAPLRPGLLLETAVTLVCTLALSWVVLRYLPWSFAFVIVILFYSAVRLPRLAAFIVYLATASMISLMLALRLMPQEFNDSSLLTSLPWIPFMLALVPSHLMTLVMHSFREERKHISESETRFRHAMEFSAIGMALVSPDGQWLQVNNALCRLFGYSPEEMKKLTFQEISYPEDLEADLAQLDTLLAGEIASYSREKRYLRRDGQIVWALLAVSLVRDSEHRPLYFISQIEDITGLKETEKENLKLMERITLANEAAGMGVWEWNLKSGEMNWDRRMLQLYHLPSNTEVRYETWSDSLHPADSERVITLFSELAKHAGSVDVEFRIDTRAGMRYIRSQGKTLPDETGQPARMLGVNQDITAFRQLTDALDQEKKRMHITLDAIGEAVISTDEGMNVIFMNPVAEKMTGWPQQHAAGKPIADILRITHGGEGPEQDIELSCALPRDSARVQNEDLVLHNRAGEQFAIDYSLSPLSTPEGDHIGSVMVIQDVSESREIFKRLRYSAAHDMLTRLPNRTSFEQRLKQLLAPHAINAQKHVLAFIDLDRFKAVNDTAGHAAGDALLCELSAIMLRQLRGNDMLARLGGDEFGVLLPECSLDDAEKIVHRLVTAVSQYVFSWDGQKYAVGASAGITAFACDSAAAEIIAQADVACYQAKNGGRGQVAVYGEAVFNDKPPHARPAPP